MSVAWEVNGILDRTDRGQPRSTLTNAVRVLQHDPTLGPKHIWHDEFLDRTFIANSPVREWADEDDTRLTVYMQETTGLSTIGEQIVSKAIRMVAKQRSKHCVRDWLSSLTWDGEPRIDLAFEDHWGVTVSEALPADYIRAASANFFIGLVARIFQPGCQLDTMVVFEGFQGVGKTSALRVLGGDWYGVAHESVQRKDFFESLKGKWLIEIGELDAFSRAEVTRVKTVISTPTDRYRPSYGRASIDFPRQCLFAGTTNKDEWGNDETGLRRFWPMRCGEVNIETLRAAREQLFAEAVSRFQSGSTWWEMPPSTLIVQAYRQAQDVWAGVVVEYVGTRNRVTIPDILKSAIGMDTEKQGDREKRRVSRILRLLDWEESRIQENGMRLSCWIKKSLDIF